VLKHEIIKILSEFFVYIWEPIISIPTFVQEITKNKTRNYTKDNTWKRILLNFQVEVIIMQWEKKKNMSIGNFKRY